MLKKNNPNERYTDLTNAYADQPEANDYQQANASRQAPRRELEGETEVTQAPPRAASAHGESIIDAESTFDGKYETGQDLRILGNVSGEILCRGLLTIERDASARARIQAQDVQVRGTIEGDVICSGRLLVTSTGTVTGTFKAATLVVEEGATLRGTVETVSGATFDAPAAAPAAISRKEREEKAGAAEDGANGTGRSGRWNRAQREVPSFALVSSEERAAPLDRN